MVRCRLRHFSDGVARGSRAWVDAVFRLSRERFGRQRQSGARSIRQLDKAEPGVRLHTLRELRVRAIG